MTYRGEGVRLTAHHLFVATDAAAVSRGLWSRDRHGLSLSLRHGLSSAIVILGLGLEEGFDIDIVDDIAE